MIKTTEKPKTDVTLTHLYSPEGLKRLTSIIRHAMETRNMGVRPFVELVNKKAGYQVLSKSTLSRLLAVGTEKQQQESINLDYLIAIAPFTMSPLGQPYEVSELVELIQKEEDRPQEAKCLEKALSRCWYSWVKDPDGTHCYRFEELSNGELIVERVNDSCCM